MSTVNVIKGKYPHVGWVDLEGQGILTEVAVLKESEQGVAFIRLDQMDGIDKQRLFRVISNRNAHMYELWDLMSHITLGNGANALDYFHQYVKVLTPSGAVIAPQMGRVGAVSGTRRAPAAPAAAAPTPVPRLAGAPGATPLRPHRQVQVQPRIPA